MKDNRLYVKGGRSPNLKSILMVEDYLKNKQIPVTLAKIKKGLPKQVMHQTLKIILAYLWKSRKIEYTPNGIKWIFDIKK